MAVFSIEPAHVGVAIPPGKRTARVVAEGGGDAVTVKLTEEQTRALYAELREVVEYWDTPVKPWGKS